MDITMSKITAQWDNPEKTILVATFQQTYSWEDYHETLAEVAALLDGVEYPYIMVNHYMPGVRLPQGSPYSHMNRTAAKIPPALLTCIVTQDMLIRRLIEVSFRTSGARDKPHVFCDTLDDAREQAQRRLSEQQNEEHES
jgi:hypothetical protein